MHIAPCVTLFTVHLLVLASLEVGALLESLCNCASSTTGDRAGAAGTIAQCNNVEPGADFRSKYQVLNSESMCRCKVPISSFVAGLC